MTYGVFKAGSSELLCIGSIEECARELGATVEQFQKWINSPSHGYREGFSIHKIESNDPLRCPCNDCEKSPHTPGLLSASCEKTHCDKWEKWARRYLAALRRKYVKRA